MPSFCWRVTAVWVIAGKEELTEINTHSEALAQAFATQCEIFGSDLVVVECMGVCVYDKPLPSLLKPQAF